MNNDSPLDVADHGLSLHGVLQVLRRHWLLIAFFVVAVPAIALAYSLHATKEYTASSTLLFQNNQANLQTTGTGTQPALTEFDTDPARVVATNIQLVSLPAIAQATAAALHMPTNSVAAKISVGAGAGDTDAVTVSATDPSPAMAATLANTYAQQYVAFRQRTDTSAITSSEQLIRAALARLGKRHQNTHYAYELRTELNQLTVDAALQTGGAELVQAAQIPKSPSSPNTFSNVIFGVLVGIVLGIGAAFLRHRFDRRIHTGEQAQEIFERPVLATVPYSRGVDKRGVAPPASFSEAFFMLRANLRYFNFERPRRAIIVTSPLSGDGKTSTVWWLGVAAAKAGQKVLIVEADLRRPTMREHIGGIPDHPYGLVDVLTDTTSLSEAVTPVEVSHSSEGAVTNLDVLLAGSIPPNPVDLVESARLVALLDDAREEYDLVLIDTPPTSIVPDAIPMMPHVDGLLVVIRLEQTTRGPALHLRDHLRNLNAPVLGVVVNCVRPGRGTYGYYMYGYDRPAEARANGAHPKGDAESVVTQASATRVVKTEPPPR